VRPDGVTLDAITGGVVLEDHARAWYETIASTSVRVPGVVVALDRLLERVAGIACIHTHEYRTTAIDVRR
jgi:hypothetical protein